MLKYTVKTFIGPVIIRECRNKTCWCFERLSHFEKISRPVYDDYKKCRDKNSDFKKIYKMK